MTKLDSSWYYRVPTLKACIFNLLFIIAYWQTMFFKKTQFSKKKNVSHTEGINKSIMTWFGVPAPDATTLFKGSGLKQEVYSLFLNALFCHSLQLNWIIELFLDHVSLHMLNVIVPCLCQKMTVILYSHCIIQGFFNCKVSSRTNPPNLFLEWLSHPIMDHLLSIIP